MLTLSIDQLSEAAEILAVRAVYDPSLVDAYKAAQSRVKSLEYAGWRRSNGTMTQEATVLSHIQKAGSITVREAMVEYSIQSLTKRISNLRQMGHDIISTRKYHPVTRQQYVRYSLA